MEKLFIGSDFRMYRKERIFYEDQESGKCSNRQCQNSKKTFALPLYGSVCKECKSPMTYVRRWYDKVERV